MFNTHPAQNTFRESVEITEKETTGVPKGSVQARKAKWTEAELGRMGYIRHLKIQSTFQKPEAWCQRPDQTKCDQRRERSLSPRHFSSRYVQDIPKLNHHHPHSSQKLLETNPETFPPLWSTFLPGKEYHPLLTWTTHPLTWQSLGRSCQCAILNSSNIL